MVEALSIPVGEDLLFDRSLLLGGALGELSSMKKNRNAISREKKNINCYFFCFQGKLLQHFFFFCEIRNNESPD